MKNRLDEFTESGGVITLYTDEGKTPERCWTIAARPRSEVTDQEVGVLELTIAPPPADTEKTRWGIVLFDALCAVEGFDSLEHISDFVVVREDDNFSSSGHLQSGSKIFEMASLAGWYNGIELTFPGLLEAFSANNQLCFASLVFQAVGEGYKIMAVGDN